jgi:O-antigen/teichoic acid export membrane protein
MPTKAVESSAMTAESHKATFFRQGGWMMISAVGAGALMFAVQIFSTRFLSREEYSAFGALIQVTNWITIPALGLQMVFAQQAAAAITENQHRQLAGTVKAVLLWTFCVWLATVVAAIIYRHEWVAALKLSNPMALWLTIALGLFMIWMQIFQGLLQGRQNFLWFGWANIANGVGRVLVGGVIVVLLGGQAAGLMLGVFIGMVAAFLACVSQNLDLLTSPGAKFDAIGWLNRVVPLTLGFGASTFLFSTDAIVVQNYLGANGHATAYILGATLCRAIVLFTVPLAAVMFPKLVHSAAHSQKSNVMAMTMIGTVGLALLAVLGLALVSPFILKTCSKGSPEDVATIVKLIPLFAFGMVPLGSGNVLLYNLMAHSRFKIVPALVVLAVGYWIALQHFHDTFKMVIETFCVFTLIYFGLCALFTWVLDRGHGVVKEPVVEGV